MRILVPRALRQLLRFGVLIAAVVLASGAPSALADFGDCVGLYPKPNCGTEPQLSGDRGGVMQYATFAVIVVGLGIILTVITRNVIRTDRAKIRHTESDLQKPSTPKVNN